MYIFKDDKRSIEIISENGYETNEDYSLEREYDLGRYYRNVEYFYEMFFSNEEVDSQSAKFTLSTFASVNRMIENNRFLQLKDFCLNNSMLVNVVFTKGKKTKSVNVRKYSNKVYSVLELYSKLREYLQLIEDYKTKFNKISTKTEIEKELKTINTYKILVRQSLQALENNPSLEIFEMCKSVKESFLKNIKIKKYTYEYSITETCIVNVALLTDTEIRNLLNVSNKFKELNSNNNQCF